MQQRIGCLVLDIQMPRMTGLELLAYLAASEVTLPIIVLTGLEDEQTQLRATQVGVVAYLRKPVEEETLLEAIQRALASGRGN